MNLATKIADLHHDRDKAITDHLVEQIDERLKDNEWLLNNDNYSRSDENEIRYRFELVAMMRGFVTKEERQWPSCQVRNAVFDRYTGEGFIVHIDSTDSLVLKIVANEDKGDDGEATPE